MRELGPSSHSFPSAAPDAQLDRQAFAHQVLIAPPPRAKLISFSHVGAAPCVS